MLKFLSFRNIKRRDDSLYLTRYYLTPRKRPKWIPGIYLHCFHASDEDLELHNHPWGFSVSFILKGCYIEEVLTKKGWIRTRAFFPGRINIIRANTFHRVDLLTDKVWTLFICFNRKQDWGFMDRETGEYIQWEEFENRKKLKTEVPYERNA